jgi:hypothetical protein
MPKTTLSLLKKGILEEFQSDVLYIPWKTRRQILEPIEELYEDDPDATIEDIYRALFYFVYGDPNTYFGNNPTAQVFRKLEVYREEWSGIELP